MKKRIFIAIHYMEIGGAEISLIGLLQAIDYTKYDVDLFVYSHRGDLMQYIPHGVNLLPENPVYAQIERPMKEALKDGYWRIVWARLMAKWKYRRYVKRTHPKEGSAVFQYVDSEAVKVLPSLHHLGTYDLAISFLTPHSIALKKVKAKKKAAWIHTDYSFIDVDVAKELPVWSGYDHIVSISDHVTGAFLKRFPSLKDKITVIHNILSPVFVRQRADEMSPEEVEREMPREEGVVNLLSVGRFCHAKNYDNVPDICRRINEILNVNVRSARSDAPHLENDNENYSECQDLNNALNLRNKMRKKDVNVPVSVNVKWYLIGYGGDEALIRQRIVESGVEKDVIILGKKSNPYPYMKACDIYVQPSRFEGNSVTVREAQILGKPVAITNYTTAPSQVFNGKDGIIVPLENGQCASKITDFIENESLRLEICDFLRNHDYGNAMEVEKVYSLVEESPFIEA